MRKCISRMKGGLLGCILFLWLSMTAAFAQQQTMKLLVIGVDGTEPEYGAVTATLDQIGVPYDSFLSVCRLGLNGATPCPLPTFTTGTRANYYGIVLTQGVPIYCPAGGTCTYTLGWFGSPDWNAIDAFTKTYGIRTLIWYDPGQVRYGFDTSWASVSTATTPVTLTLAPGQTIFTTVPAAAQIPVATNDFVYTNSTLVAGAVPVLNAKVGTQTYPVAAQYTSTAGTNAGSTYLTLTFDSNQNMLHAMVLGYDLVKWVTKGMFLGAKKAYLSPQVDDVFIPDDLYDKQVTGCYPTTSFSSDPVLNFAADPCPTLRITSTDLQALYNWQTKLNAQPQTAGFRTTLAFNGVGTVPESQGGDQPNGDTLVPAAETLAGYFDWISHTYDHPNLDCYSLSATNTCVPATLAQATSEIAQNVATVKNFNPNGLGFDALSMVTPEVSGLANPNFIQAAYSNGVRYLVSDTSKTGIPGPNQGIINALNPAILEVPRYPTNIFYNVFAPTAGVAGSETDEYNLLYGPGGLCVTLGFTCFASNQTYAQILDTESNSLLSYMLKGYANPSMYHQTNLHAYDTTGDSLFTDVIGQTIQKFEKYSIVPILSQSESAIGQLMQDRMAYNASGVEAVWTPGVGGAQGSISLTAAQGANITLTFAGTETCPLGATCEPYAGQTLVHVNMASTPTFSLLAPQ